MFSLIWVFHRKVSFCKFPVRGPQSQKLSCHSTITKPLLNASMPFCLLLTDNKHLETFKFSQNLQFPSSLPEVFIQSAATPQLGDTQRFSSLSPSSKSTFHLKVTISFNFTFCLKIDSGTEKQDEEVEGQIAGWTTASYTLWIKQQHRNTKATFWAYYHSNCKNQILACSKLDCQRGLTSIRTEIQIIKVMIQIRQWTNQSLFWISLFTAY